MGYYKKPYQKPGEGEVFRVRLPKGTEVLGIIEQLLGGSKMRVKCLDGHTRICRVPGKYKRRLWLRESNIVLVEPWEYEGDKKGDVIFKYQKAAEEWLRKKGYIKITEEF